MPKHKPDINRSWFPHKMSNYNIIDNYETADIWFSWACDGPMYHTFGICWKRKCFRKSGDEWRSIVDGSVAGSQWNINSLLKETIEVEKGTKLANDFLEDASNYLKTVI